LAIRGISVLGGLIDADYAGNINLILSNNSKQDFEITAGDRIGQVVFYKHVFIHSRVFGQREFDDDGKNTGTCDGTNIPNAAYWEQRRIACGEPKKRFGGFGSTGK